MNSNTEPEGRVPLVPSLGSYARGGFIPQPDSVAVDGDVPVRIRGGQVWVMPVNGSDMWRDIGTMDADGIDVYPPSATSWLDEYLTTMAEGGFSLVYAAPAFRHAWLNARVTAAERRQRAESVFRYDSGTTDELAEWATTGRTPASWESGRIGGLAGAIERSDRVVDKLCPCGAEPGEGFAPYCSYDCTPNWRGEHTISDRDRTVMRWRPDLVSNVDDTGLTPLVARQHHGDFYVEVFERAGTDMRQLHVRLDDGHRWVGADLPLDPVSTYGDRYADKLRALRRELQNNRHAVPEEHPTVSDTPPPLSGWGVALPSDPVHRPLSDAPPEPRRSYHHRGDHVHWALPPAEHTVDVWPGSWPHVLDWLRASASRSTEQVAELAATAEQRRETLRRVRQGRNGGPRQAERAPRRIDPRRGR